jgi:hypothetical protein
MDGLCEAVKASGAPCTAPATKTLVNGKNVCIAHYKPGGRKKKVRETKDINGFEEVSPHDGGALTDYARMIFEKNNLEYEKPEKKRRNKAKQLYRGKRQCDFLNIDGERCRSIVIGQATSNITGKTEMWGCRSHLEQFRLDPEPMLNRIVEKRASKALKGTYSKMTGIQAKTDETIIERLSIPKERADRIADEVHKRGITYTATTEQRGNFVTGKHTNYVPNIQVEIPRNPIDRVEKAVEMAWKHLHWIDEWLTEWAKEEDLINTVEQTGCNVVDGKQVDIHIITKRHATFKELAVKMFSERTKAMKSLQDLLKHQSTMLVTCVLMLQKYGIKFDHEAGMLVLNKIEEQDRESRQGFYEYNPALPLPPKAMTTIEVPAVQQIRPWGDDWNQRTDDEGVEAQKANLSEELRRYEQEVTNELPQPSTPEETTGEGA